MYGYAGQLLRVDLDNNRFVNEKLHEETMRKYVGGTGLGVEILYNEVPPEVECNDPGNRMIFSSGPMAGTVICGSGTFSVVTKGPMTNLAVATQANGFFGAFLKFSGFDAVILQGKANKLSYLDIHDETAELRDATHLEGRDTFETEQLIRSELKCGKGQASVYGIGPAGENLVRFAGIVGDEGHVAAHGGVGAALGAKKIKAIAARRREKKIPIYDEKSLAKLSEDLFQAAKEFQGGSLHKWGTAGGFSNAALGGWLPVKNYTTNIFPEHERLSGQYFRTHFEYRPKPCWACRIHHCSTMRVTEGPYVGYEGEEPKYECIAAWGPQIGQTDPGAVLMLTNLTDRLGLDVNESGWLVGWVTLVGVPYCE